jgi:uncharacterized protein YcfJ
MLKMFVTLLIIPFLYSCQNVAAAQEDLPEKKVAYAQAMAVESTKRARKQQRNICKRLRKIKERIEKRKKHRSRK